MFNKFFYTPKPDKMKRVFNFFLLLIFVGASLNVTAQSNCANYIRYHAPTAPYKYSSLSKSATCITGKNYNFVIPLSAGKNYRVSFYASTIFDNKIEFILNDSTSNEQIIFLPGDKKKFDDLSSYFNNVNDYSEVLVKAVDEFGQSEGYPYFEIEPTTAIRLSITINVLDADKGAPKKGCVGVFIQDKLVEVEDGF